MFTSLALLFDLSVRDVSSEIEILFLPFIESVRSRMSLAIWLNFLSELKSLVPQCNIMLSGLKSWTAGFAWLCEQPTLAKLNGRTLTRLLWLSFGDDWVQLTLISVLLWLLLFYYYYYHHYYYYYYYYYYA